MRRATILKKVFLTVGVLLGSLSLFAENVTVIAEPNGPIAFDGENLTETIQLIFSGPVTGDVTLQITGENKDEFTVEPATLTVDAENLLQDVTVTYANEIGKFTAALEITGTDLDTKEIILEGLTRPAAPELPTQIITAQYGRWRANWEVVPDVDGYKLYFYTKTENERQYLPNYEGFDLPDANVDSRLVLGLTPSTPYYYVVTSYQNGVESEESAERKTTTPPMNFDGISLVTDWENIVKFDILLGDDEQLSDEIGILGVKLTNNIKISTDKEAFVPSKTEIIAEIPSVVGEDAITYESITVSFLPKEAGKVNATLTIESEGVRNPINIALEGIVRPVAPVVGAASDIKVSYFTANWTAVEGANGYYVSVYDEDDVLVSNQKVEGGEKESGKVTGLTAGTKYYYTVQVFVNVENEEPITSSVSEKSVEFTTGATGNPTLDTDWDLNTAVKFNVAVTSEQESEVIRIIGENLTHNVVLTVDGEEFVPRYSPIEKGDNGTVDENITVLFTPKEYGKLNATLIIESEGADPIQIKLESTTNPVVPAEAEGEEGADYEPTTESFVAKWKALDESAEIDGYLLYVYSKVEGEKEYVENYNGFEIEGASEESYPVTGLTAGTAYFFQVAAYVDMEGLTDATERFISERSKELEVTTLGIPEITLVPEDALIIFIADVDDNDVASIDLSGVALQGPVVLTLDYPEGTADEDKYFTLSIELIEDDIIDGDVVKTFAITYTPAEEGSHRAELVITTPGVETITIQLIGTTSDEPAIFANPVDMEDFFAYVNEEASQVIAVKGVNLEEKIELEIEADIAGDANMFKIDIPEINQESGLASSDITVTYKPEAAGEHKARLVITSKDAEDVVIDLNGTSAERPLIKVLEEINPFDAFVNEEAKQFFTVEGANLIDAVLLDIEGDKDVFELSKISIEKDEEGKVLESITLTYKPKTAQQHNAVLVINSEDAEEIRISLVGTGREKQPAITTEPETLATIETALGTPETVEVRVNGVDLAENIVVTIEDDTNEMFEVDKQTITVAADGTVSEKLTITFKGTKEGPSTATLVLTSGDIVKRLELSANAVKVPVLNVDTEILNFIADVENNNTQTVTFTGSNLTFLFLSIEGPDADLFDFENSGDRTLALEGDGSLNSTPVNIVYSPDAEGIHEATLVIKDNGVEIKTVALDGRTPGFVVPVITAPSTVAAIEATAGETNSVEIEVGGAYLKDDITLALSGTDETLFELSTTTIAKGEDGTASGKVTITYKPVAAGDHTATLTITSQDAETKTITLTGKASPVVSLPEYVQALNLYGVNGYVYFTTEKAGINVEIYNSLGQSIYQGISIEGENSIRVVEGILLVKVGNQIGKVIIK